ncbi:MAG: hypothetical protein ACJAVN_001870, partial [Roseivirga sp.]
GKYREISKSTPLLTDNTSNTRIDVAISHIITAIVTLERM